MGSDDIVERLEHGNAGEVLREVLMEEVPFTDSSWAQRLDDWLCADGELVRLLYDTTINYAVRRLITSARNVEFITSRDRDAVSPEGLNSALRERLRVRFRLPRKLLEPLLIVLLECIRQANRRVGDPVKAHVRRALNAKTGETRCYICGVPLAPTHDRASDRVALAEVEHVWPQSLGGSSNIHNLKPVCSECNRIKGSILDGRDSHYERMAWHIEDSDDVIQQIGKDRIALLAAHGFRCTHCHKPAQHVGGLRLCRIDTEQPWHFLNITTYCGRCATE